MIRIITIEREYGTGAPEIARELAARMGWKLWDELLTQEIAHLAHCEQSAVQKREERLDPLYYRLLKSFALGGYEGNSGPAPIEMLDSESIFRLSENVIRLAAAGGNCVIVGRGSQHFLRNRDGALHFFLYASPEQKIRRLLSQGKSESEARALVNRVDGERAAFIKRYFHLEWPNRSIYHAMINTDIGSERVIRAVMNFILQAESTDVSAE